MTATSMGTLVKGLLAEQAGEQRRGDAQTESVLGSAEVIGSRAEPAATAEEAGLVEASSEVASQRAGVRSLPPRAITDDESALLGSLGILIDTPRDAKRLVNIYRMVRATRDLSAAAEFLGDGDRPGQYQAVVLLLGLTTFNARIADQVFHAPARPDADVAGGVLARAADGSWRDLVADLEPTAVAEGWRNGVLGELLAEEIELWTRAHRGLDLASKQLTLTDLAVFQAWIPKVRRFSFIMPSSGVVEPAASQRRS